MVRSPYEWKILEWDAKPLTIKKYKKLLHFHSLQVRHSIVNENAGKYFYLIRCKEIAGNESNSFSEKEIIGPLPSSWCALSTVRFSYNNIVCRDVIPNSSQLLGQHSVMVGAVGKSSLLSCWHWHYISSTVRFKQLKVQLLAQCWL